MEKSQKKIIDPGDICIIAINTKNIAVIPCDPELPAIIKAVYPFGNLQVVLDKKTMKIKETRHEQRDSIKKKSGSPVSTSVFLDHDYEGISAVIYSHVDCANRPEEFGADFVIVHNAIAKNQLDIGTFEFGQEYRIENEHLIRSDH